MGLGLRSDREGSRRPNGSTIGGFLPYSSIPPEVLCIAANKRNHMQMTHDSRHACDAILEVSS